MTDIAFWVGVADLETPVGAFLKLAHGQANSFLLESIEGGSARGRYSVIGMAPDVIWRCRDGVAEINRVALSAPHAFVAENATPLESLRALAAESRLVVPSHLPPMAGGLTGYLGYDMVRQMEKLPAKNADRLGLPEAIMLRPTLFAIFDNVRDELVLAAPAYGAPGQDAAAADPPWARHRAKAGAAGSILQFHPCRVPGRGRAGARLYRRRRCVSGGAEPAVFGTLRAAAFRAVSSVAPDQSRTVPVLPGFRRFFRGRQQPGNPGAAT
jgi:hypothetical protein